MERLLALVLLALLSPFLGFIYLLTKLSSPGPFFFRQKRTGKNKQTFILYKIRTMQEDAEKLQHKLRNLNEADGPVFKIRHDPRFTKIGKFLSHTGLDEIPQLINIIRGEMSFVGPRPLPLLEANTIPTRFQKRYSVLPGITSLWTIKGAHKLRFHQWMRYDMEYIAKKSIRLDLIIITLTIYYIIQLLFKKIAELIFPHLFPSQ